MVGKTQGVITKLIDTDLLTCKVVHYNICIVIVARSSTKTICWGSELCGFLIKGLPLREEPDIHSWAWLQMKSA